MAKDTDKQQQRRLLKRVMGSGRGRFQTHLAMLGFTFGLILVLGSLNLVIGIHRATRHGEEHAEYLIVNKRVTMTGMLTYIRPTFTDNEIDQLRARPFVSDLGKFITSRFRVSAMPGSGGAFDNEVNGEDWPGAEDFGMTMPLYTDLFFESVPDRFLDVQPRAWEWTPDSPYLPIIMSREFLNLYNFSFALAQGLPQIPESLIGSVAGSVSISGPGGSRTLRARVVGLSDRIPSIIVPESFMTWANREIAGEEPPRPSRLMLKTDRPADPAMLDYFQQRNLQVNSERLRSGRLGRMAVLALSAVGGIGALFVALSLFLFVLLARLILAEAGPRIRWLLQLGYSPAMLAAHALRRFWFNLAMVALITAVILTTLFPFAYQRLRDAGFDPGPALLPATVVAGFFILALTGLINLVSVRRAIYRSGDSEGF